MTTRTELDDLKAQVDLVELLRHCGLSLKKVGKNWMCRCPFHYPDDTASLSVNPEERLWQCFGCKAGGDALSFLQLKEGLEFPQALERLRDWMGQPKPAPANGGAKPGPSRPELMERIAQLYHQHFWDSPQAHDYLKGRGLAERDLWQAFRIGYCDGSLVGKLPTEGPVFETLQSLGVLNAEGKEHFRGCLVVPLTHPDRGVVGILRPPAQPQRHHPAPVPTRPQAGRAQLDRFQKLLAPHSHRKRAGRPLALAGRHSRSLLPQRSGRESPSDLRELLVRFKTREVVLMLDGDRAGREAVPRLQGQLEELGLKVIDLPLPDGQDPNDLLRELGTTRLTEWFEKAVTPRAESEARWENYGQGFGLELGDIRYEIKMLPPFSSRLRVRLRGTRGESEFLDKLDLYLQRSRDTAATRLARALKLQRFEAETHLKLVLERAEDWVKHQHSQADEAKSQKSNRDMTPAEREETLQFLRSPDLVDRILEDMEQLGYVGEENPKLLVYLVGLSRKLPKPLSAVIISGSGVGKSSLTEMVEFLTPDEEVTNFTRLTAQVLYYFPTSLSHTLLILEERGGSRGR